MYEKPFPFPSLSLHLKPFDNKSILTVVSSAPLEFAKKGGGHHTLHTHWNGHMSGFYFLKGSEKTSLPIFEDPRPGNLMNLLPEKDKSKITYASSQISYSVKPGKVMFFLILQYMDLMLCLNYPQICLAMKTKLDKKNIVL